MKKVIRNSIFETNSSSNHSMNIVQKKDFQEWIKGNYLYDKETKRFVNPYTLCSYEDFFSNTDDTMGYVEFEENYTTPGGEEFVVFGYWGYDG